MTLLPYWGRITKLARAVIAQQLLIATSPVYYDTQQRVVDEQMPTMTKALSDRVGEIVTMTQEKQHQINLAVCNSLNKSSNIPSKHGCDNGTYENTKAEYDQQTAICSYERKITKRSGGCHCGAACPWKDTVTHNQVQLPTINRIDLRGTNGVTNAIKEKSEVEALLNVND